MSTKSILIIIGIFISCLASLVTIVSADISLEETEQIFEMGEKITNVAFIDTVHISRIEQYTSFRISKNFILNLSSVRAYDYNNSKNHLDVEIKDYNDNQYLIIVKFPRLYTDSEIYKFTLKFETNLYVLAPQGKVGIYPYSWGDAGRQLNLTYKFTAPVFYEFESDSPHSIEYNKINSILSFNKLIQKETKYEVKFTGKQVQPPNILVDRITSKQELERGEVMRVIVFIQNIGGSVAKDIDFEDRPNPILEHKLGDIKWFGDLPAGGLKKLEYSVEAIGDDEKITFGEGKATYTDLWETQIYENQPADEEIVVKKEANQINLFGLEIPLRIDNPLIVVYNFLIGYGILTWLFVIIRIDEYKKWKETTPLEKIIYSIITAGLNSIPAAFLYLIIYLIYPSLLLVKNLEYVIPLVVLPITALLLNKILDRIKGKGAYIAFYFLVLSVLLYLLLQS